MEEGRPTGSTKYPEHLGFTRIGGPPAATGLVKSAFCRVATFRFVSSAVCMDSDASGSVGFRGVGSGSGRPLFTTRCTGDDCVDDEALDEEVRKACRCGGRRDASCSAVCSWRGAIFERVDARGLGLGTEPFEGS